MKNQDLNLTISVNATPEETMKKISQVNGWWARNFTGKASSLNDKFSVHFGKTFVDFQISQLIPNQKVVWKVTDCNLNWITNKKEWKNTEVVFAISTNGNATEIDFTHIGLVPAAECYNDCKAGWSSHIINSLANFITKGKGMPE